jgi:hypothetical protein
VQRGLGRGELTADAGERGTAAEGRLRLGAVAPVGGAHRGHLHGEGKEHVRPQIGQEGRGEAVAARN